MKSRSCKMSRQAAAGLSFPRSREPFRETGKAAWGPGRPGGTHPSSCDTPARPARLGAQCWGARGCAAGGEGPPGRASGGLNLGQPRGTAQGGRDPQGLGEVEPVHQVLRPHPPEGRCPGSEGAGLTRPPRPQGFGGALCLGLPAAPRGRDGNPVWWVCVRAQGYQQVPLGVPRGHQGWGPTRGHGGGVRGGPVLQVCSLEPLQPGHPGRF